MRTAHRPPEALLTRRTTTPCLIASVLALACDSGTQPGGSTGGRETVADPTTTLAVAEAVKAHLTIEDLDAHARAIVANERPSGSAGEFAAIDYLVSQLTAAGVPVSVDTFQAFISTPGPASVAILGSGPTFTAVTPAFSASTEGTEALAVELGELSDLPGLELGTGERLVVEGEELSSSTSILDQLPEVRGRIAIVTGQPRNVPTLVLERLGAVGAVFVHPDERVNDLIVTSTWGTPSLRNYHRLPTIPVVHVRRSDGDALRQRMAEGPVRLLIRAQLDAGWRPLRLATARIDPEGRPDAPYVLFGGHIDGWYHAGTDEGASNAAMVSIAKGFHAARGRLRRGLVVAWWPGHSNGRYAGATWYADTRFEDLRRRAVAYVNVDGIGQTGARAFGAATTRSLAGLAVRTLRTTGQDVRPTRPGRNSDQAFNGIGLPLLQLYHNRLAEDGGYWWWHTPDDTYDKIDLEVLRTDAALYVDALAALTTDPRLPVDIGAAVEELDRALESRAAAAGGRLDVTAVRAQVLTLSNTVRSLEDALAADQVVDLELVAILRPLHRVLYVPDSDVHPDPGLSLGALPGLAAAGILGTEDPASDRYRLAEVTLVRELNRVREAVDLANERAARLLSTLGPQG